MKTEKYICEQCGLCCQLFLINLNENEYKSGEFRLIFDGIADINDFVLAEICGANILKQNIDGSCIYLKNGKCSIHDSRPEVCRYFFCKGAEKRFAQMRKEIEEAKKS